MRVEKCECQKRMKNVNDNIGTRGNKSTMFCYIMSCNTRPRSKHFFTPVTEKVKFKKKKKTRTLPKEQ